MRLWYADSGGPGVPIVLMHPNTGNADCFGPNTPGLVEAGYRVIAFDRRGWGRSMAAPETGPQPGTKADDLSALVDFLELAPFHLVGVAGGGFIGYDYAGDGSSDPRSLPRSSCWTTRRPRGRCWAWPTT